jgi:hypothetical protein
MCCNECVVTRKDDGSDVSATHKAGIVPGASKLYVSHTNTICGCALVLLCHQQVNLVAVHCTLCAAALEFWHVLQK